MLAERCRNNSVMIVSWLAERVFKPQRGNTHYRIFIERVYIPYEADRRKSGQQPLSKTRQMRQPTRHLVLMHFLSKVAAQCAESMHSSRITSYTKVREREVIS
jgi:hypothetical protein